MTLRTTKKVLVVRLSSIGDIVLTTPVLRSLKQAQPGWTLHYLTKADFVPLLAHNPYVDRIHTFDGAWQPLLARLRDEHYDHVLDLHHNLRTLCLKLALGVAATSVHKRNLDKYLLVRSKRLVPPIPHIVERYGDTLLGLGLHLDEEGLELYLDAASEAAATAALGDFAVGQAMAVVLGAQYATKRWPAAQVSDWLLRWQRPAVLIGGPDARSDADAIVRALPDGYPLFDAVARHDLLTSAAILRRCRAALSNDTGFMHIAAAFGMQVFSLWGSTVPALGMTPYRTPHHLLEVSGLSCRPCSKIGHARCPRGHFRCMNDLSPETVMQAVKRWEEGQ
ncbi:MAG: glycosyltransferase family 9 protein [Bacteroidia bacterium]